MRYHAATLIFFIVDSYLRFFDDDVVILESAAPERITNVNISVSVGISVLVIVVVVVEIIVVKSVPRTSRIDIFRSLAVSAG